MNESAKSPVVRVFDCHVARRRGENYEYLLLLRAPEKIYAGSWRMVGGKIREGESAWKAALRELAEETGLRAERLFAVPFVNRFYEWQHDRINDIPVFVALTDGSDPRLDSEHTRFEWVTLEGALERLPWPGQCEGVRAADRLLKKDGTELQAFVEVDLKGKKG